jgi:hypothetical protein
MSLVMRTKSRSCAYNLTLRRNNRIINAQFIFNYEGFIFSF